MMAQRRQTERIVGKEKKKKKKSIYRVLPKPGGGGTQLLWPARGHVKRDFPIWCHSFSESLAMLDFILENKNDN